MPYWAGRALIDRKNANSRQHRDLSDYHKDILGQKGSLRPKEGLQADNGLSLLAEKGPPGQHKALSGQEWVILGQKKAFVGLTCP